MPVLHNGEYALFLFPERIKNIMYNKNSHDIYGYILHIYRNQIFVYEINQIQTIDNISYKTLKFTNNNNFKVEIDLDTPHPSRFHIYLPEKNIINKLFNTELKPKSKISYVKPSFAKEGTYNLITYGGSKKKYTKKIINFIDKYSLYSDEHRYFCFEIKYNIHESDLYYSVMIKIIDYNNVVTFMHNNDNINGASITTNQDLDLKLLSRKDSSSSMASIGSTSYV